MHSQRIRERAIELRNTFVDGRRMSPQRIVSQIWRETGISVGETTVRAWIDPDFAERERRRKAEWARANDSSERKARKNAQQRERYRTDSAYRERHRKQNRERRST